MSGDKSIKPQPDLQSVAQNRFEKAVRAAGFDPENKWIGGYFDYEWTHLRPLFGAYDLVPSSGRVLEFGCNVGASSLVMAAMGGDVTGIDVDASMIEIASANAERHGMANKVVITHVADTRDQPFDNDSFDLVLANSVLEYVQSDELPAVIREIYRVLKPGGQFFICGTASRIAPKEIHSGRWFVNYLPRAFDRLMGKNLQRGLSPFLLARAIQGYFTDISSVGWRKGRVAVHGNLSFSMRMFDWVWHAIGVGPGWASSHIELLLRKN